MSEQESHEPTQKFHGPWENLTEKRPLVEFQEKRQYQPGGAKANRMDVEYGEGNWKLDRARFEDEDPHAVDALGHTALQKVDILVSPDGVQHKAAKFEKAADNLHAGVEDLLKNPGKYKDGE